MNLFQLFLPALLLIAACQSAPETKDESNKQTVETVPDSLQFAVFYQSFDADIRNEVSLDELKKYVDTEQGLWIIDANGAMPRFTQYTLLNTAALSKGIKIVQINNTPCKLLFDSLPVVDCDKPSLYSKDGCFAQKINLFAQQNIWLAAELKPEERSAIEKLANTIDYTVIQTTGFRYYFSKIGSNWFISFIDTRKPCEA